jgi:hypothetical protein
MPVMITLNKIYGIVPYDSWDKIPNAHGHVGLDIEFPLSSILDSNGLEDTLLCFNALPEHIDIPKRFALWCSQLVRNLMEDEISFSALNVVERYLDGDATIEELKTAYAAVDAIVAAAHAVNYAANATRYFTIVNYAVDAVRYAVDAVRYAVDAALYVPRATKDTDMKQKQIDKLREMIK